MRKGENKEENERVKTRSREEVKGLETGKSEEN